MQIMSSFKKLRLYSICPSVNPPDYGVLRTIKALREKNDGGVVRVSDIVNKMQVPPPAVSRSLRNLEQKGLTERNVDKNDRRNTCVSITPEGVSLLTETEKSMSEFSEAVFGQMGEENVRKLNAAMRQLLNAAETELARRETSCRSKPASAASGQSAPAASMDSKPASAASGQSSEATSEASDSKKGE